jgi:hypothetical protein
MFPLGTATSAFGSSPDSSIRRRRWHRYDDDNVTLCEWPEVAKVRIPPNRCRFRLATLAYFEPVFPQYPRAP